MLNFLQNYLYYVTNARSSSLTGIAMIAQRETTARTVDELITGIHDAFLEARA